MAFHVGPLPPSRPAVNRRIERRRRRQAVVDRGVRRLAPMSDDPICTHLDTIATATAHSLGCEECLAIGGRWVHLRLCQICGHVGCCDQSPNRHATKHYHATTHSIIKSFQPGEEWGYCYPDDLFFETLPGA
jgi:uncharacterized UBP type Zn finger protein